ncbi:MULTISPECIES: YncE family protein [Streptomyces]|uniref:YncE family protein n=1 Tax=Streptomyces glycanivorans TaxID=3033808 RepID=A0ABY9J2Z6_9ACTN|nr:MULTISPECIES: YncE family protein [unclassified Streptomyces]WSQ75718.1 YncE family protein [Streptomyces sp. NBC_01213]TXS07944.1 YncE family protein [Streptomyces sp. wa22]WLQ62210.1 YncE family protein [Streptomyces sp. Alt3]WSQ82964.1 YncE family protein [Streptomyces sp. NBC_01212]WSR11008.1 YncE family protein [Streptomyces sp. NBC_01208]
MDSPNSRVRRIAAIAVTLAVGSVFTLTRTAAAGGGTEGAGTPPGSHVTSVPLAPGLYQSAYSERNGVLWATASVGQPPAPVTGSQLLRIDPGTLEVQAAYTPPTSGTVEAVYGIDVDDEHDTLWVTNTRDNSVAVYSQSTGRHLVTRQNVNHSREVVVDEKRDLVWASAFGDGALVAFDTRTFKEVRRVTVEGGGPTGLTVDERTGTVYAADFTNDQIIEVAPGSRTPRLIPTGEGPLSIALSTDGRSAYTADQTSGTLSVVDLRKGVVATSVRTGKGAKSVAVEACSGRVLVADRLAASVSVVDPRKGAVVESVTTDAYPNHVEVTDGGTAYVLDKSGSGPAGEDGITRIRLHPQSPAHHDPTEVRPVC